MECQVGTVGASLIPTLRGGSDGTEADRIPQHLRAVPFVVPLIFERPALFFGEVCDIVEVVHVARDHSRAAEEGGMFTQVVALGKRHCVFNGLLWGFALREGGVSVEFGGVSRFMILDLGAKLTFSGFSTMLRAAAFPPPTPSASSVWGFRSPVSFSNAPSE